MDNHELVELLTEARSFLEHRWDAWRAERGRSLPEGAQPSTSMCRFSALFLAQLLRQATGDVWIVVGGDPEADEGATDELSSGIGGMLTTDGRWRGHYWIVDEEEDRLVDVTADQFGHEPIILTDPDDPRYAQNYADWEVDDHLHWVRDRVTTWLREAAEESSILGDVLSSRTVRAPTA